MDLDGFKDVNTAHGYPAGDAVLCDTAARLQRSVRPDDVVARLGGDEFAILAAAATPEAMCALAERTLVLAARPRAQGRLAQRQHRLGDLPG